MARFAFRFHPLYRVLGAPFGITGRTAMVEVVDGELNVRFGPWVLRTPLSNVTGCSRTGPFSIPKTAGPAHLSVADRGVTFATNPEAGLCLRFAEPVPAIDPFGWIRHPGLTVTVERLDDLERAVSDAQHGMELEQLSEGVPAQSPWSVLGRWARWPFGMALATARYLGALGDLDRTYERRDTPPPPLPAPQDGDGVQDLASGVGPVFERTYRVRIAGASRSPEELLDLVGANFNRAAPTEVAEFGERRPAGGRADVDAEYQVRMPGPWDGPVRTVERSAQAIRLATLEGHMEAGQIEFRTSWDDEPRATDARPALLFEIRSVARSGDRAFNALYDRLPLAREMQLHTWVHFCRRVAELAGGTVVGKPEVRTVRYRGGRRPKPVASRRAHEALRQLHDKGLNFDLGRRAEFTPENGWRVDDYCIALPPEPPGDPVPGGSWETGVELMRDYEFADPSIVRAVYHPDDPLEGRTMLLEGRFYGLRFMLGVRVGGVNDTTRSVDGRQVRVWGWNYRTLQGHLEMGQMDYEMWKWLDTGDVEFRIHAFSRAGIIPNPVVRLGFALFGRMMQKRFARRALQRMDALVRDELISRATHTRVPGEPVSVRERLTVTPAAERARTAERLGRASTNHR